MDPAPSSTTPQSRIGRYISLNAGITLILAAGMLTTGTINTLSIKFQDQRVVKGIGDGPPTAYQHAFFQTACMFVGELICLLAFRIDRLRQFFSSYRSRQGKQQQQQQQQQHIFGDALGAEESESEALLSGIIQSVEDEEEGISADGGLLQQQQLEMEDESHRQQQQQQQQHINPLIFWIPACCDLGGTTLLNIGLFYTSASVYQMLRGTLVVFNGIFSVLFLKHRLYPHHWGGILLITLGTAIVGVSSIFSHDPDAVVVEKNPMLGNILVVSAQVLAATQFIVEEKFLSSKPNIAPLQVVGWEGYFGLSMTTIALFVLYWIPGSDHGSVESAPYAIAQIIRDTPLAIAVVGSVCSIAFFNFCGVMITKRISSTTRATIDSCRTFFIWLVSLALGWETFVALQVVGFVILVLGTFIYNEVVRIPRYHPWYLENKQRWVAERDEKRREKRLKRLHLQREKRLAEKQQQQQRHVFQGVEDVVDTFQETY